MTVISDLRSEHADTWRAATGHRFINEMGDGSLEAEKFRRYFLQDYVFVNDLVKMAGIAVSKAPNLVLARPIEEFLNAILGAEDALFIDAFKTLGIPERDYQNVEALPTTAAMGNFLVRLAYEGPFSQICTAMYVTEGVYLDWGERLKREGAAPESSGNELGHFYRGWIDLHDETALGPIVGFLESVVDESSVSEMPRVRQVFERALRYEVAFWDMAYEGERWP